MIPFHSNAIPTVGQAASLPEARQIGNLPHIVGQAASLPEARQIGNLPHIGEYEAGRLALALIAAVLGLAFFLTEHDLDRSAEDLLSVTAEDVGLVVESGSAVRPLAFLGVAGLGLCLLVRRQGHPLRLSDPAALLLLALVAWSAASLVWSEDRLLTAKRLVVIGSLFLGTLGLARQLSARQLRSLTVVILGAYILVGIGAEVVMGTLRPWSDDYRFGGTVHPNSQGLYCAGFCLAAASGLRHGRRKLPGIVLCALGAALLLLTRSRTALLGLSVALAAMVLLQMSFRARVLAAVAAAWIVGAVLFVAAAGGSDSRSGLASLVLLGRTEEVSTISGRVPLWTELLSYVRERPWQGYGFDSFWNARHIEEVSAGAEWVAYVGHSIYLDAILSVGLVGAAMLFAAAGLGAWRLAARCQATGDDGCAFLFGLLVMAAVSGLLESAFVRPMFLPMVAACGVVHAAFRSREPRPA